MGLIDIFMRPIVTVSCPYSQLSAQLCTMFFQACFMHCVKYWVQNGAEYGVSFRPVPEPERERERESEREEERESSFFLLGNCWFSESRTWITGSYWFFKRTFFPTQLDPSLKTCQNDVRFGFSL